MVDFIIEVVTIVGLFSLVLLIFDYLSLHEKINNLEYKIYDLEFQIKMMNVKHKGDKKRK